ncbi:hypothetical protein BCAR13_70035 [Paraburkholderia caribensis]|nr:hypothetical protein BCAR13_70035 [Paraburkholderia caribensis]
MERDAELSEIFDLARNFLRQPNAIGVIYRLTLLFVLLEAMYNCSRPQAGRRRARLLDIVCQRLETQ